jgi:hypothetical protein
MKYAMVLLVVGLGCGGDDDGTPIQPTSGTWGYLEGDVVDDTCHYSARPDTGLGTFTLTNPGTGTFTITPPGETAFNCTLSGSSFTCPDRSNEDLPGAPYDATVNLHVAAYGSFSSATAASGHQRLEATCTGTQCAEVGALVGVTFPCGLSVNYTASLITR